MDATQLPDTRSDRSAPTLTEDAPRLTGEFADPHSPDIGEGEPQPSVARDRWVTREQLLANSEHAMYGARSAYGRRSGQPLPRPKRFRSMPKWQSWGVLIAASAITLGVVIGAVLSGHAGAKWLAPTATATPTAIHHATATPAATSSK